MMECCYDDDMMTTSILVITIRGALGPSQFMSAVRLSPAALGLESCKLVEAVWGSEGGSCCMLGSSRVWSAIGALTMGVVRRGTVNLGFGRPVCVPAYIRQCRPNVCLCELCRERAAEHFEKPACGDDSQHARGNTCSNVTLPWETCGGVYMQWKGPCFELSPKSWGAWRGLLNLHAGKYPSMLRDEAGGFFGMPVTIGV